MTRTDLALAALASAAVPGMKPVSVIGIRPGTSDRDREIQRAVVEDATGRTWTVHSPMSPVAGARLQRNEDLVRQLPRHVPFKVPAAVGKASVGRDGAAVVYPHLEGLPLDLDRLPAGAGLAHAIGRAVAAIHNIPREVFEQQDVPVFDAAGVRQRTIAEVDRAAETGRVPTGLLARWEEAFEAAPLWQFATTPVHGAFSGASLLVTFADPQDAASGRVVAVVDWDEACVGDPATDLAELYQHASPPAWEAVLDSYSLARAQRPDPYLHARARLLSELTAVRGLATAVESGRDESVRRSVDALRRLDRLTEDDDSLVPTTARRSGTSAASMPPAQDGHTATGSTTESAQGAAAPGQVGGFVELDGDDEALDATLWDRSLSDDADQDWDEAPSGDMGGNESVPHAEDGPDLTVEVPRPVPVDDDEDPMAEAQSPGLKQMEARSPALEHPDTPADEAGFATGDPDLVEGPADVEDADHVVGGEDVGQVDDVVGGEDVKEVDSVADSEDVAVTGSDDRADVDDLDDLDDLDDEERLHELYGMPESPAPEQTDPGRSGR